MNVWRLPRLSYQAVNTVKETRPTALITQPDWAKQRAALNLPIVVQAEPTRRDQEFFDHLVDNLPSATQVIYALGEGVVMDAGKYVSMKTGKPLVVVPTMLNDAGAFSPDVTFSTADAYTRIETGAADLAVVDLEIIQSTPAHLRAAAITDVLSVVTALMDWGYAAQKGQLRSEESFSPWGTGLAAAVVQQGLKNAAAIGKGEPEALKTLVGLLCMTVQLDSLLGHRRASQGAEHIFAEAVRMQPDAADVPFAERLASGILITYALHKLQEKDATVMRSALEAAGVRLKQIKKADILTTLLGLPAYVKRLHLPYTILNDLEANPEKLAEAILRSTLGD